MPASPKSSAAGRAPAPASPAPAAAALACLVLAAAALLMLSSCAGGAVVSAQTPTARPVSQAAASVLASPTPTIRSTAKVQAAATSGTVVLRFAVWGDTRPGTTAWPTALPLGLRKMAANLGTRTYDFSVGVGDYTFLSPADSQSTMAAKYSAFLNAAAPLRKKPVYYVVGNHEMLSDTTARSVYHSKLGTPKHDWYLVKRGSFDLIVLSAFEPGYSGTIGYAGETSSANSAQARWLVTTLRTIAAADRHAWIVVAVHCPPFDAKTSDPWYSSTGERPRLVALFERYGVDAVVAGHLHFYRRHVAADGITYLTQGTGGAPSYAVNSTPLDSHDRKAFTGVYGYTMFTLRSDGSLKGVTWEASPSGWVFRIRDSFTLTNRAAR